MEHPALIGFSKATCPTLKSHVLLSPAAATTHTLSIGTPRLQGQKGWWVGLGQVGGSGKLSPSQSHEPRSNVATAVAAGEALYVQCV